VSFQTKITFIVQSEKKLSKDDKDAIKEYASDTIANCIEDSEIEAISDPTFGRSREVK